MRADPMRVQAMLKVGIPAGQIARRLRKSERQIRRIMAERGLKRTGPSIAKYLGTPAEHALWQTWMIRTGSHEQVAFMFGVRRDTVWFKLGLHKSIITLGAQYGVTTEGLMMKMARVFKERTDGKVRGLQTEGGPNGKEV